MKSIFVTAMFIFSVVAAHAGTLKAHLSAEIPKITKAMKKRDMASLEKIFRSGMTKDFIYIENGQKQGIDTMISNMKMGLASMKTLTVVRAKTLSVTEKGNSGVATTEHFMEGIMVGPDNKEHKMGFSGVSTDTYVKVKGSWKMSKMAWKNQKMLMDGKPMAAGG